MIELRKLPGESREEFIDRVALTAPVPGGAVMERLRQLLPPADRTPGACVVSDDEAPNMYCPRCCCWYPAKDHGQHAGH